MADTGIFCTTAEVRRKAGSGASSVATAEAYINQFVTEAESYINVKTRFNWSDVYAAGPLNADMKGVLKEAASCLAAIYVVSYDMSGYANRIEAEDVINVLRDAAERAVKILDKKAQDFINEVG